MGPWGTIQLIHVDVTGWSTRETAVRHKKIKNKKLTSSATIGASDSASSIGLRGDAVPERDLGLFGDETIVTESWRKKCWTAKTKEAGGMVQQSDQPPRNCSRGASVLEGRLRTNRTNIISVGSWLSVGGVFMHRKLHSLSRLANPPFPSGCRLWRHHHFTVSMPAWRAYPWLATITHRRQNASQSCSHPGWIMSAGFGQ